MPPPFFEAFFGSVQQAEATAASFRLCEESGVTRTAVSSATGDTWA